MSLDLCFWQSPPPETAADGYQLYSAMSDGDWQLAEAAPEVPAFRRALIAAHEIKSLAEDHWLVTFVYADEDDWFVDILRKHGRPVDPPVE